MFVRARALITALSINYISTLWLNNDVSLDKCVSHIVRRFCLQSHNDKAAYCTKDIMTNFDLKRERVPQLRVNFRKGLVPPINYCPKLILLDVRAPDVDVRRYMRIAFIKKCRNSLFLVRKVDTTIIGNLSNLFTKITYFMDKNLRLYVIEPYVYGNASRADFIPKLLGNCQTAKGLKFSRSPKKWPNTTLKIYYRDMPPFVNDDGTGIEQNILRIVLDRLDMKNMSQMEKTTYQDDKNDLTGNYTNTALLSLQHKKVDAAVGTFHPTEDTERDFDGSVVYEIDTLNIIAPKSPLKTIWLRILEIYSAKFTTAFFLSLILTLVFIHSFYKVSKTAISMWFFQIITETPINNMQRKCSFRIAMSSLLIFCVVHSTSFKNALQLIYFSKEYQNEIYTKEDMRKSGVNVYTMNEKIVMKMKNSPNKHEREVGGRMYVCEDIANCLNRIAFAKDFTMLFLKIPIIFAIPKYYMDKNNYEPLLHVGESFQIMPYQMMFQKNYPPFDDIDDLLNRICETGILNFEEQKKIWDWYMKMSQLKKYDSRVLKLVHLEYVFVIWAMGLLSATMVFLGELINHRYFQIKEKKQGL